MRSAPLIDRLEPRTLMAAYLQDDAFGDESGPDLPVSLNNPAALFVSGLGLSRDVHPMIDARGRLTFINVEDTLRTRYLVVRRLLANGQLDDSLDRDGLLRIIIGTSTDARAAVLEDGSVVVNLPKNGKPVLEKYSPAGVRDDAFARSLGKTYKALRPTADSVPQYNYRERNELSVDDEGRIVYTQATVSQPTPELSRLQFRVLRFNADGKPDESFGDSGGLEVDERIAAPLNVDLLGRNLHNVSGAPAFSLGTLSVAGSRVTVSGSLEYARGSGTYSAHLRLPILREYGDDGRLLRAFESQLEPGKAKWSGQSLAYSGANFAPTSLARDGDGLLYFSTETIAEGDFGLTSTRGVAVFEAKKTTFKLRSVDATFGVIAPLYRVGDSVVATDARRLVRVQADATAGEVISILPTERTRRTLTFAKPSDRWPARVYLSGAIDARNVTSEKVRISIIAADLLEQSGTIVRSGKSIAITGTDAGDYITIVQRKRDGRYVIAGAGPTRSFAPETVSRLVIRSGAGDDRIEYGRGVFNLTSSIDAGRGDDVIKTSITIDSALAAYVGTAADTIMGGPGFDVAFSDEKDTISEVEESRDSPFF